jgi:hypothetical protein
LTLKTKINGMPLVGGKNDSWQAHQAKSALTRVQQLPCTVQLRSNYHLQYNSEWSSQSSKVGVMGGGMFRPEPKEPGAKRTRKTQEWSKENFGKNQQKFSKTTRAAFFTGRQEENKKTGASIRGKKIEFKSRNNR